MIRLNMQGGKGYRFFRSRWGEDDDPFKVIDEDISPELAVKLIDEAADSIHRAMRMLADNDEEIVFELRKYTNASEGMTLENYVALMTAILICSTYSGRAHIRFRSEREMVDVLGTFLGHLLDSIVADELPTWMETLKDWLQCSDLIHSWYHVTDTHSFRIAALALNLIGKSWRPYDTPEYDRFGVLPHDEEKEVA